MHPRQNPGGLGSIQSNHKNQLANRRFPVRIGRPPRNVAIACRAALHCTSPPSHSCPPRHAGRAIVTESVPRREHPPKAEEIAVIHEDKWPRPKFPNTKIRETKALEGAVNCYKRLSSNNRNLRNSCRISISSIGVISTHKALS